jgi:CO dehydrogenase maturation factor
MLWRQRILKEKRCMKFAFVGKGGSGKTTLASLFARYLAVQGAEVLAIDADINQHLSVALGLSASEASMLPAMGLEIDRIKEYVRGSNPRIGSNAMMVKTTPPGHGSRLLTVGEDNPIYEYFAREVNSVRLMATGPFSQDDLGLKCYHSKIGAVELLLNHLRDEPQEYVVVDMTAGADSFASGMFTKFDLTFAVVEPTLKSLSVYQQYINYAKDYDVQVKAIGNKIEAEDDIAFLHEHIGDSLLTWMERSDYVRAMEKGRYLPLNQLEAQSMQVLATMRQAVDGCEKDWEKFYRQTVEFHRKNALEWANAITGEDLTMQIDPDYELMSQVRQAII